jgi:ankyrin repeat protein
MNHSLRPSRARDRQIEAIVFVLSATLLTGCGMPEPNTPMTIAARNGDASRIAALAAKGEDPDGRSDFGLTPLVIASRLGHVEAVRALLRAGAGVNLMDSPPTRPGWTPLMNAAHKGRIEVVRVLLESGANANARAADGTTALMLAASEPHPEVVRTLLDAGADPRAGHGGSAALTAAVAMGSAETVALILAKDPAVRLERGLRGHVALWAARLRGKEEIVGMVGGARQAGKEPQAGLAVAGLGSPKGEPQAERVQETK